ncbi:MAG: WecB/TagA/CpsF family glycosyltransferase [Prevotella sp.]|nr:WecB/TagA/CpsF family glycosyltransferase [Prevotella sp.]MDD5895954.1 WecB/TagA/CpsF family glycosyltransferase [Prevotellaceae bacterium]
MRIFGFEMEFDHDELRRKIESSSNRNTKGYICVVDGPSLARSYKNAAFLNLLQQSYANTCDGGSVAFLANRLTKQNLKAFTGPEIFAEYVVNPKYRQVLLGNTESKYKMVKEKVAQQVGNVDYLYYVPLPFVSIDEFNFEEIARKIDSIDADIIWVSLGAPKQEFFMQRLLPHLNHGVMLGVGAAFSYYLDELKDYKFRLGEIRMNWILRLFTEPKKQFNRVGSMMLCYPRIYYKEKRKWKEL